MSRVFVVNVENPEVRVAELRAGKLFDFDIERDARLLGNIYKGRVENIIPGMDAAFVDIGSRRNALLYVGDVKGSERGSTITQLLKTRQEVLVQVARPPVGSKGARVTTRLSLPGRYAILVAGSDTVGVSKRIPSDEERGRLRRIADKLRPFDHGIIIRTEAEGANESAVAADIANLVRQLAAVAEKGRDATAPSIVHEDLGLLGRIARDRIGDDVSAIYIDSRSVMELFTNQLRSFSPNLEKVVSYYNEQTPIFEKFGVSKDIDIAMQRRVPLSSGGSLVIDEAEALTAIDVNTGSFVGRKGLNETVLATNLEAVAEIARQVRFRDLGGMVVIDFIDMERTKDRVKVLNALEAALKEDRGRSRIVQISPSGLVEMTRRREGQSLLKQLNDPCPYCEGLGYLPKGESIAIAARRTVREMAMKNSGAGILIQMNPETACIFIGEDAEWVKAIENDTGCQIRVRVDETLEARHTHFERILPGVPLARELIVGSFVPLSPSMRFFPKENPQFFVANQNLVYLDKLPELATKSDASILVEITNVGRHYAVGKTAQSRK
jgi:ribonuclease G